MSIQTLKTPNARLVYRSCHHDESLDLSAELLELERLIQNESRFQWAHAHAYCYFFKPSDAPGFKQTAFWLAKEVIGPPNEDFEGRFGIEDLEASEVLSVDLKTQSPWPLWQECFYEESRMRQALIKKYGPLAPTWRLEWDLDLGDPLCRLQFFRA